MLCLILPNYTQSSNISVLVFDKETQCWKKETYSKAISSLGLPKSWARGIPGPVQQKHPKDDFVLGQIATSSKEITYQSWACRAGLDTTGRDVFLTLLAEKSAEVKQSNQISFDNVIMGVEAEEINDAEAIERYEITEAQKISFDQALRNITQPQGFNASSIQEMLDKAQKGQFRHYVSASFDGMSYLPDSEQGGDVGLRYLKKSQRIYVAALIVFLAASFTTIYEISSKKKANRNSEVCDNPSTSHNDNSRQNENCKDLLISD